MKDVPWFVWVCLSTVFLGVIAAFTVMTAIGADTTEFSRFMNTLMNGASVLLTGLTAAFASSAAINAKRAAVQTNGVSHTPVISDPSAIPGPSHSPGVTGNGE